MKRPPTVWSGYTLNAPPRTPSSASWLKMKPLKSPSNRHRSNPMLRRALISSAALLLIIQAAFAQPRVLDPDIQVRKLLGASRGVFRMAEDPRDHNLYLLFQSGAISRIELTEGDNTSETQALYTATDHKVSSPAGFAIGPDGTMYLTQNKSAAGGRNVASITKGVIDAATGERVWSILAQTEPFEQCDCIFNHQVNGTVVSPDNRYVYVNSGSRTDHGEIQDNNNRFPGMREVPLSSAIFRLPTNGQDLVLPAADAALRASGYLYADGVRNAYDLAFAANGDLFATENAPDRDMAEELNWLREGHHYGFPWRMGLEDNPQRSPDYNPAKDPLLPKQFTAVREGYYHNDPTFPPPPAPFTDPVLNLGPDADSYRDPNTGEIKDASEEGAPLGTFTAHRSPLGLVFDVGGHLGGRYTAGAFVLSWTEGDPIGDSKAGPFKDAGQDLLHLELTKVGDNYQAHVTRIADKFANPIDAVLVANQLYVLEYGGSRGVWELTFPEKATAVEEELVKPTGFSLGQNYPNPFNATTTFVYQVGREVWVSLSIFDLAGQRVRSLVNASQAAGSYAVVWDGTDDRGQRAASGAYLYRLQAGDFVQTRQLALIK
ncbi:MAG: T9SS type A sorting domain-containing protein [Candidatus Latescibacteria bacterium]|nr:T9SS type A sorting domain-containing protein [Candidatus Latescibacterota bacterium]